MSPTLGLCLTLLCAQISLQARTYATAVWANRKDYAAITGQGSSEMGQRANLKRRCSSRMPSRRTNLMPGMSSAKNSSVICARSSVRRRWYPSSR